MIMAMQSSYDVCVVGGGIIGLAVARELRTRLGRSARLIGALTVE